MDAVGASEQISEYWKLIVELLMILIDYLSEHFLWPDTESSIKGTGNKKGHFYAFFTCPGNHVMDQQIDFPLFFSFLLAAKDGV